MDTTTPIFSKNDNLKFFRTLNSRVNNYFKENNLDRTGNWKLHLKTVVMFSVFLTPYFILLAMHMPIWAYLLLNVVIGIGMAGVGMNVMHDGNHGAYSSKSWVNKFMGGSIYILAGNVYNWQVQHNVLHHTYTNILGHDEDLEAGRIMRFTKEAKWYKLHRFQHLYSVFLYGLLTFTDAGAIDQGPLEARPARAAARRVHARTFTAIRRQHVLAEPEPRRRRPRRRLEPGPLDRAGVRRPQVPRLLLRGRPDFCHGRAPGVSGARRLRRLAGAGGHVAPPRRHLGRRVRALRPPARRRVRRQPAAAPRFGVDVRHRRLVDPRDLGRTRRERRLA